MVYGWIQMVAVLFGMFMGKIFCREAVRGKKAEAGAGAFGMGRDGRTSLDTKMARMLKMKNNFAVSHAEDKKKKQNWIRSAKRRAGNKYRDRRLLLAASCLRYP